jgi:hypothetical protein
LRRRAADRAIQLQARGMDDVQIYDPRHTSVGGTHAIFLLRGSVTDYNLPVNPVVPTQLLGPAWRSAALAGAFALLATAVAFLTS